MTESQEVDTQPYLESKEHKCAEYANPGLKDAAFVAEDRTDACCQQHYQHHEIRNLFVISDVKFCSFRSKDCCHTAEKHRYGERGCDTDI